MDEGGDCLGNDFFPSYFYHRWGQRSFPRILRVMSSAERNKWWMLDLLLAWPLPHSDHEETRIAVWKDAIDLWGVS